jgi:hypothetical protein
VDRPQSPPQCRSTSHGIHKCSGSPRFATPHPSYCTMPATRTRQHRSRQATSPTRDLPGRPTPEVIVISSDDENTRPGSSSRSTIKPRMVKKPRHLVDNYKSKQVRLPLSEFQFRTDSRPLDQRAPREAGRSPTQRNQQFE